MPTKGTALGDRQVDGDGVLDSQREEHVNGVI